MIYKYLAIGDIHWGAMDSKTMYNNLQFLLAFIYKMKDKIDLVVICGDYFDYRLQLSSKTSILANKFIDDLHTICKYSNVKAIRIIKGTKEHDNDQLEVIRPRYETNDNYFKIFNTTTLEETLPELNIFYGPDEVISRDNYLDKYKDLLLNYPNIGFFHGNFDVVLPSIEIDRIINNNLPVMIYQHKVFGTFIKGPLISSHWHVATTEDPLYYIGSYDRWMFGEEEPKGFIYGTINTEDNTYSINRIENPYAAKYTTITYSSDETNRIEHFTNIEVLINEFLRDNIHDKIRVVYLLNIDNNELNSLFESLQRKFSTNPRVKFLLKDILKKNIKKKKKEAVYYNIDKYSYIFENPTNIAENIARFIADKKGQSISIEDIDKCIGKYLD